MEWAKVKALKAPPEHWATCSWGGAVKSVFSTLKQQLVTFSPVGIVVRI